MTEISRPWSGIVTGDAGPYTDDDWSDIWQRLFSTNRAYDGVIAGYLNELEVTGTVTPVSVNTGGAMVDGKVYNNSAAVTVAIPTPAGATRVDLIVLRKDWAAQTVRITRIAGTEGAGAPSITQIDGTTWDILLAQVSITTGGTITVTDRRSFSFGRIAAIKQVVEGRLTLATATPVTTTDQTAKTTIFFTPYKGNKITIWDGTAWKTLRFTEKSVAVPATTVTPFDIFAYIDSNGQLAIETLDWTNDTTRATAIVVTDGVYTKSGDKTRLYLGTGRTTGVSGQCEDSLAKRFLWNYYNRVPRTMSVVDTTQDWTYTTATWRQARGSAANQVECVIGVAEVSIQATTHVLAANSGGVGFHVSTGVGINSTSVNSSQIFGARTNTGYAVIPSYCVANLTAVGFNYIAWLEISAASGTTTWLGDNSTTLMQSGMNVVLQGG